MNPEMDVSGAGPVPAMVQRRRSWFGRNWWWLVPLLLLVMCGGCCLGVLGIFGIFGAALGVAAEPYAMALEMVQQDPVVVEQLGQPIGPVVWPPPSVQIAVENGQGECTMTFDVQGPKGKATVVSRARLVDGRWGINSLTVELPDGQRLSINTGEQQELKEAPPWKGSEEEAPEQEAPEKEAPGNKPPGGEQSTRLQRAPRSAAA